MTGEKPDEDSNKSLELSHSARPELVASVGHVLLTLGQAARRMGVSVATVRRMEGTELLPVVIDGKHCFPIEEVDRHRKVADGDLAAAAFQMFNDDRTQVEVVIALKEAPERIRGLHQCWVEMGQCIVASSPGPGHRVLQRQLRGRLTREIVQVCLQVVLTDRTLVERAERQLGHRMFPDG